jgi:hypothetical protein
MLSRICVGLSDLLRLLRVRDGQSPARVLSRRSTLFVLVGVGLIGTAIKLRLALTTFGCSDVDYWMSFKDYVVENGTVSIYAHFWYYNHPPMMSGLLLLLAPLVPYAPNGFPFLIRLPAILSDGVSGCLLYSLISRAWGPDRGFWATLLFWASPVAIMISGYHGNTDPIFMMLVLLAARQLVWGKPAWQVGALLGLACNVKLVPVVTVPLFFFWLPTWQKRAQLAAGMLAVLALGYGYHGAHCFAAMKANIFDYNSDPTFWGVPGFHISLGLEDKGRSLAGHLRKPLLILLAIIGLAFGRRANRAPVAQRPSVLLVGLAWIFLVFLVLAPGFGVQYLAWLNVVFPFLSLLGMLIYNLLAGTLLFRVYDYWHRGGSWEPDDLDKAAYPVGNELFLAHVVWLFLALWVTWSLGLWWARRRRRLRPPGPVEEG